MNTLFEQAFSHLVKTDFSSRKHLVMDWSMAVVSLVFGVYAWMYLGWSALWPVGGVLSVVLAIVRPVAWLQRQLLGMIKRPSN